MTGAGLVLAFILGMLIVGAAWSVKSMSSAAISGSVLALSGLVVVSMTLNESSMAFACAISLVALALVSNIVEQERGK